MKIKLFTEGGKNGSDQNLIHTLLKGLFNNYDFSDNFEHLGNWQIDDEKLNKIKKNTELGFKSLVFIDVDFYFEGANDATQGGLKFRTSYFTNKKRAYEAKLNCTLDFELFFIPFNDNREGKIETLLDAIKKVSFDSCYQELLNCCQNTTTREISNPGLKNKIYLYSEILSGKELEGKEMGKDKNRDFNDTLLWDLESEHLKPLIEFLKIHIEPLLPK